MGRSTEKAVTQVRKPAEAMREVDPAGGDSSQGAQKTAKAAIDTLASGSPEELSVLASSGRPDQAAAASRLGECLAQAGGFSPSLDAGVLRGRALALALILAERDLKGGTHTAVESEAENVANTLARAAEAEARLAEAQRKLDAMDAARESDVVRAKLAEARAEIVEHVATIRRQAEHITTLQRSLEELEAGGATSSPRTAPAEGTGDKDLLMIERRRREALELELIALRTTTGKQAEANMSAVDRALRGLEGQVAEAEARAAAKARVAAEAAGKLENTKTVLSREQEFRERAEAGWKRSAATLREMEQERDAIRDRCARLAKGLEAAREEAASLRGRALELEGRMAAGRDEMQRELEQARADQHELRMQAREAAVRLEAATAAVSEADARSRWQLEDRMKAMARDHADQLRTALGDAQQRTRDYDQLLHRWRDERAKASGALETAKAEVRRQVGALNASLDTLLSSLVKTSSLHREAAEWVRATFELKVRASSRRPILNSPPPLSLFPRRALATITCACWVCSRTTCRRATSRRPRALSSARWTVRNSPRSP